MREPRYIDPVCAVGILLLLLYIPTGAQISRWQIGGDGRAWSENDSVQVMIDFTTNVDAIQPVYFTPDQNILQLAPAWHASKYPPNPDGIEGPEDRIPRIWRRDGNYIDQPQTPFADLFSLVDGDLSTYSRPVAERVNSWSSDSGIWWEWYTIDLAVPVPASRFGFFIPSQGYRSFNGEPALDYIVPGFEISVAADAGSGIDTENYQRLETLIADVTENVDPEVFLDFPRQYVRFVRYKRKASSRDVQTTFAFDHIPRLLGHQGGTLPGVIAEFILSGKGAPARAFYLSRIVDLGRQVNFGRIFWAARSLAVVDGLRMEDPDADVSLQVKIRSGRTADPLVYHERVGFGKEMPVSRERYESLPAARDLFDQHPGTKGSVIYDAGNWTFWTPVPHSGALAPLRQGRYLQLSLTLESRSFDDLLRLDSLWVEMAPPLASRIVGEVAFLETPPPKGGLVQVPLGETAAFSCDIRAHFDAPEQRGFDALRITTGSEVTFRNLSLGTPLTEVVPARLSGSVDTLEIHLPQRITAAHNLPIRIALSTRIFLLAQPFTIEVFDSEQKSLPQHVEPGDASEEISTGSLRVIGSPTSEAHLIQSFSLSAPALTPNGDGVNDRLEIRYELMRLSQPIPVHLRVYCLDGRRVASFSLASQISGAHQVTWDGRDEQGASLPPGIYLLELLLQSEFRTFRRFAPVGVVF